jgi:hypothetical protein
MKSDLSKVKVGDKIWTIEDGWEEVISINLADKKYPIETKNKSYTFYGKLYEANKHPSAFLEYPFKEQEIEKDTIVYFRDTKESYWKVGHYSHSTNGHHCVFQKSKKSTETNEVAHFNIVTTENPFL